MSKPPYRKLWTELIDIDYADLREIISSDDLFDGWELDQMPEGTAADELHHAFDLLYAGVDPKMARQYLDRSVQVAEGDRRG